jgi:hypothetical protein
MFGASVTGIMLILIEYEFGITELSVMIVHANPVGQTN